MKRNVLNYLTIFANVNVFLYHFPSLLMHFMFCHNFSTLFATKLFMVLCYYMNLLKSRHM